MIIRNMNHSDIEFACHITRNEGWEAETREMFESFLAFDPKGCFIAEVDEQPIGMSVALAYKKNGFIGEVIVSKAMRGRGYGSNLFEQALGYLKSAGIKNIYLDADLAAVSLYEKFGFRKICRSLRFNGKYVGKKKPLIKKATAKDLDEICRIDSKLFADDRSFFLRHRQERFPHLCYVAKKGSSISGYIFGYPGIDLIALGPLAVLDKSISAADLLASFALAAGDNTLHFGVLESNIKAVEFFRSVSSLSEGTHAWRMVLGESENLSANQKLFTIGSAAKG